MRRANPDRGRAGGFTLVELMLVAALTMVLMFGAIYSASESFSVVGEGDARVHTNVQGRRALDRLLKDCRYSAALTVAGSSGSGWTITIDATSTLDPDVLVYSWSPDTGTLTVSDGVLSPDVVLTGLTSFDITAQTTDPGTGPVISRIRFDWVLEVASAGEAGAGASGKTLALSGASWVRVNA